MASAAAQEMRHLDLLYQKMIDGNEEVQSEVRRAFKEVHILVVGVSGSGKSTLIRLMMGDTGPRTADVAAQGQLLQVWRHPDPHLPLTIYESNGVDASGNNCVAEIKRFLDKRLPISSASAGTTEQVHAVWYVFSAIQDSVLDDGGLLKMLRIYGEKLPLLLVMTHDDAEINSQKKDALLEEVLGSFSDRENRNRETSTIIRLGNDIDIDMYERTGEILCKFEVDERRLRVLSKRTNALVDDKERRTTWAACQVVDVDAKIEESGKLILQKRNQKLAAGDVDQMEMNEEPLFQKQGEMTATFGSITRGLAKIWNSPGNVEKAIISGQFLDQDYLARVEGHLESHTTTALAWLVGAGASVMGVSHNYDDVRDGQNPLLEWAWKRASTNAISIPKLVVCFGLHVMGALYYFRVRTTINGFATGIQDWRWDVGDWLLFCKTYGVSKWANVISEFCRYRHYAAESVRSEPEARRFLSSVIELFGRDSLRLQDVYILRPTETTDAENRRRRQTLRVLVVGDERENVEAFLRTATDADSHQGIATRTRSASGPCVCSTDVKAEDAAAADLRRRRPLPKQDGKSVATDLLVQQPLQNLTFPDHRKGENSSTSTPLKSSDTGKEEVLRIAVWEARDVGICFHQPLNINQSLLSEEGDHDDAEATAGSSIDYNHPFHIHSDIRAQLHVDYPANASCVETWAKWLDEEGMHLCVLVASSDNTEAQFKRFLHHYYDVHEFPKAYSEYGRNVIALAACSPLLILRSRVLRSRLPKDIHGNHATSVSSLSSGWMAYPGRPGETLNVNVMEWLTPRTLEEEASAVCEFVRRNVIQACNCTIRWSADGNKRALGWRILHGFHSHLDRQQ